MRYDEIKEVIWTRIKLEQRTSMKEIAEYCDTTASVISDILNDNIEIFNLNVSICVKLLKYVNLYSLDTLDTICSTRPIKAVRTSKKDVYIVIDGQISMFDD